MKKRSIQLLVFFTILMMTICLPSEGQTHYWHNQERTLRYKPDNNDFVITNGTRRFNRAIYGTNTAFRIEAGDLPEFAFYMPGMGGNFQLGIIAGHKSKWLKEADNIEARYHAGSMLYNIHDSILDGGSVKIIVLALSDAEGMILKIEFQKIPKDLRLAWVFGGATGKTFSRDGDLNVDPESSFYLKPENCTTNQFEIHDNTFILSYGGDRVLNEEERYNNQKPDAKTPGEKSKKKNLIGAFPESSEMTIADAYELSSPISLLGSKGGIASVIAGSIEVYNDSYFFQIQNPALKSELDSKKVQQTFKRAETVREALAGRIKINTPDPYINAIGPALGIAADAIWENPTYLHGAIGWRIRLNGWRGPYTGDDLGWHDRAKTHFSAYAQSQVISPDSGPSVPDPEKNLARQEEKMGNALYTSGYICRNPNGKLTPHHYDMNLVYIDALLRHFFWTGDTAYVREMWPVIKRHLAWEKRNFDGDNDGLYNAYCCIWASDALQYNGGGVTHSSAYNYLANKTAAYLAGLVGENPQPYAREAEKIFKAMNSKLWMPVKGWYAEYQDYLGLQQLHPAAALWTVYHTLDSEVPDPFKAYQCTRYIDTEIPHIPVKAKGLTDNGYYVLSTTNWMPYEWSINNVVPAELMHTSLAYWQANRSDEAFKLWKSSILDAMYLGSSPGNFLQISFYDANRGEAYRDFADEIGMASRSLVEGLFGIHPNLLEGVVNIQPGIPSEWNFASLQIPDISFDFKRSNNTETYTIIPEFAKTVTLNLRLRVFKETIKSVKVNGNEVAWKNVDDAVGSPQIEIAAGKFPKYSVVVELAGERVEPTPDPIIIGYNNTWTTTLKSAKIKEIFDPQKACDRVKISDSGMEAFAVGEKGNHTVFVRLSQGQLTWWMPINFEIKEALELIFPLDQPTAGLMFTLQNNTSQAIQAKVEVNPDVLPMRLQLSLQPGETSKNISVPASNVIPGNNLVRIVDGNGYKTEKYILNWKITAPASAKFEKVDLSEDFNDKVTRIYQNEYLSPRCPYPTLALPKQGYGDWCSPMLVPNIDDTGLRKLAGESNEITIPQGIPFATPGKASEKNILFTSLWDNYPNKATIALNGKASHAYLLMAGSTYAMQSQLTNGVVFFEYTDGTVDSLELRNPETWWPLERDYMDDGYAFKLRTARPVRIHLKTGEMSNEPPVKYDSFKGIPSGYIDGGAATVLDLPLNPSKTLKNLELKTVSTEVVIGLMGITLVR